MVHQTWALQSTNQQENLHLLHRPAALQWRHPLAKGHWRRMGHQTWGLLPTSNLLPQCRHCHRTAVHVVQLGKPAHQIWHMQETSHTMMVHRHQGIGLVVHSTALSYWPVSHLLVLVRLRATVLQTWDMLQTDLQMRVHALTVDQCTAPDSCLLVKVALMNPVRVDHWKVMVLRTWGML